MPQRTTNRPLTVVGLLLAMALAALEATVVSTAMPTVVGELHGIQYFAWVAIAYLIASSVTVPIFGKLSDIYRRKPILLFGIVVFLIGSAASGAARTMPELILFRAIQGLGAGAVQPITITIIGDIFDLKERSKMQGIFGAVWGAFGLLGPIVGGFIVDSKSLGWRWIFYINLPFGLLAMILIVAYLHERVPPKHHDLDFVGAALLTVGVSAVLLASNHISLGISIASGAVGAVLLVVFFFVERRAPEPMIALPLFGRPVILIANVIGGIIGGSMMALMNFVPLYVQGVLQGTTIQVGSAMTPMLVGWPIASALSGRLIPKVGFRPLIRLGAGITAAAGLALAVFGAGAGLNELRVISAVFGVGMGFANTALVIVLQTSVTWEERGVVTASAMFVRTLGGALAVAVLGGVLTATVSADPSLPADTASKLLTHEGLRSLDPAVLLRAAGALRHFSATAFWMIAGLSFAALLSSFWFPRLSVEEAEPKEASNAGAPAGH